MVRTIVFAALLGQGCALAAVEPSMAQASEHAEVTREACGADPQAKCLAELRKVCHDRFTFRCYYSRKGRLDAIREVGFPEERAHIIDE